MNYSFINNYKSSDFQQPNPSNLYNEYKPYNDKMQGQQRSNPNPTSNDNYYWTDYSEGESKNNWATDNSIQKSLMKGLYEPTPIGELFFSQTNMDLIQKMIKYEVFDRTNGKYVMKTKQNETDLLVIMRDIFINCCKNLPYKVIHQVKELNKKTVEKIIPDMISMIRQDDEYIKQLDRPINPIPLPICVSSKGRLSLPSTTTTFFYKS